MKIGHKQPLQQSLLDRLIDDSPGQPDSGRLRRGFDLKALRQSVRRDLENLLNSRVQWHTWPDSYTELPQSLLNYGLPHFFFHTTTAYAILRHSGVEIGKKDYIGSY